jgi:hypothetical protein
MPPRKRDGVIGLYLVCNPCLGMISLEGEHCGFLLPDLVYSRSSYAQQHVVLVLRYGRQRSDVDTFMEALMAMYPLLVMQHTLFSSAEDDAFYRFKQTFKAQPGVSVWVLTSVFELFDRNASKVEAVLAYMRARDVLVGDTTLWTPRVYRRIRDRLSRYLELIPSESANALQPTALP